MNTNGVLVVEDDCKLVADFSERWPTVKKSLWEERGKELHNSRYQFMIDAFKDR